MGEDLLRAAVGNRRPLGPFRRSFLDDAGGNRRVPLQSLFQSLQENHEDQSIRKRKPGPTLMKGADSEIMILGDLDHRPLSVSRFVSSRLVTDTDGHD